MNVQRLLINLLCDLDFDLDGHDYLIAHSHLSGCKYLRYF